MRTNKNETECENKKLPNWFWRFIRLQKKNEEDPPSLETPPLPTNYGYGYEDHEVNYHALKGCGFLLHRKTDVFLHRLKIPSFRRYGIIYTKIQGFFVFFVRFLIFSLNTLADLYPGAKATGF